MTRARARKAKKDAIGVTLIVGALAIFGIWFYHAATTERAAVQACYSNSHQTLHQMDVCMANAGF